MDRNEYRGGANVEDHTADVSDGGNLGRRYANSLTLPGPFRQR
jgi:hypothetical protein